MYYLTKKELKNIWDNGNSLSEHSGVGHVVPYLDEIFEKGLQKMVDKFKALTAQEKEGKTRRLFFGAYLALTGLQKYFENYADLCHRRIQKLSKY